MIWSHAQWLLPRSWLRWSASNFHLLGAFRWTDNHTETSIWIEVGNCRPDSPVYSGGFGAGATIDQAQTNLGSQAWTKGVDSRRLIDVTNGQWQCVQSVSRCAGEGEIQVTRWRLLLPNLCTRDSLWSEWIWMRWPLLSLRWPVGRKCASDVPFCPR